MPTPLPRSRGGRGPQVGPGTFEGRTASADTRPTEFSHIAWSRGDATPDVELWCFLKYGNPSAPLYDTIAPTGNDLVFAWIDQVPNGEAFVPPNSQPTLGNEVELALKDYAATRLLTRHNVPTLPDDWTVRVARPFNYSPAEASELRFGAGVYKVWQADRFATPIAWLWVGPYGSREIWFFYKSETTEGFAFVGRPLPGSGQPYTSTRLLYAVEHGFAYPSGPVNDAFIATLKTYIKNASGGLVYDVDDLQVHDYRIGPDV